MKPFFLFFTILLLTQISWSQKMKQTDFVFNDAKLESVLSAIEQKFEVKFSYADSIIALKKITLPLKKYTLEELTFHITKQTDLSIIKINQRYFSIAETAKMMMAESQLKEVLIEGLLTKGINKVTDKVTISPQKMELLPGVTDADILLSIQQLPGVKSPNETASGLHIRGGTSDQNLIIWNGIRMYHPGHLFGMISGFNPNITQTVHYYNKATNSKFGERISSIIDIKSTDKIPDQIKVIAGINAINADLYLHVPIIKNKLGLQLSGRKSFTEWIQTPTFNSLAAKVFQNTNLNRFNDKNQFKFQDYSAKINYVFSNNSDISLTTLFIDNNLNFNTAFPNATLKNQKMTILNKGYSLNWNLKYNSQWSQNLVLYYSAYRFDYRNKIENSSNNYEQYKKLNRITDSGMELNYKFEATNQFHIEYGYQLFGNDVSHAFTSNNQNIEIDIDNKRLYNTTHVGYASVNYSLNQWNFRAGARYNFFNKLESKIFEPRLFLQNKLSKRFTAQFSFEKKSQIISQVKESVANDLSLENYVWVLSDKSVYPIIMGHQYTTGIIYKTKTWLLDLETYYKTTNGITSLAFGFLNQFDSTQFEGKGFTKGVDFLVQKSATTWKAWLTYTYQDSQNKYEGLNNNQYFAVNSEIKHALTLSFHKKWNKYSMAMGWFCHTGKPYSLLNDENQIVAFNTQRLPLYHRLDLSGMYQFHDKKSWSGSVGFSIFNVYHQQNIISKEYERQYGTINQLLNSSFNVQNYYSLGFTPNVFLRVNL